MNKKISAILIIAVIIIGVVIYQFALKPEEKSFSTEKAVLGILKKQITDTGTVKTSEEITLRFKSDGRIQNLYVDVGDMVKQGQQLAKLDASQLLIQLEEAQAELGVSQAKYNKLLAGSAIEEINVAEAGLQSAQISLDNAKQDLKDEENLAQEDLNNAYEDAFSGLDDSYLKIYNAYNKVIEVYRAYFSANNQEGLLVKTSINNIKNASDAAKASFDKAENIAAREDIDLALEEFKKSLSQTGDALKIIRDTIETPNYWSVVSSADKSSIDTHKANINTAYTNTINAKQTISSTKVANENAINAAKADISTTQAKLKEAEENLALVKAGSRQEDIDLALAEINQAKAQIQLFQNKIDDTVLKSPTNGQITKVEKEIGETVQPLEMVFQILSSDPLQIKADIYEEDIVNIDIGDLVDINFVAFPGETFKGKVVAIDPAEKLIDDVVYYEITINFENSKPGIKPGMTADIAIETDKKDNVLLVPKAVIEKKDGKAVVGVLINGKIEEREIETGLEGNADIIEIISGLKEGEEVVIR